MKFYFLFCAMLLLVVACKNPFQNKTSETAPADLAIENTDNGKVLLRLNSALGTKQHLTMDVDVKPEGMMIPLNTHLTLDVNMRVADNTDGVVVYHLDFQRVVMNTSVLGTEIKYDSQEANPNVPNQIKSQIESILAKKVVMHLDSLAHITEIELDGNEKKFEDNAIDLNALFIPLPEEPVGVGSQWQAQQEIQNIGNTELNYEIKKISDAEVLIQVKEGSTTTAAKVEGQYLIDRKTGFTKNGQISIQTSVDGKGLNLDITIHSENAA